MQLQAGRVSTALALCIVAVMAMSGSAQGRRRRDSDVVMAPNGLVSSR